MQRTARRISSAAGPRLGLKEKAGSHSLAACFRRKRDTASARAASHACHPPSVEFAMARRTLSVASTTIRSSNRSRSRVRIWRHSTLSVAPICAAIARRRSNALLLVSNSVRMACSATSVTSASRCTNPLVARSWSRTQAKLMASVIVRAGPQAECALRLDNLGRQPALVEEVGDVRTHLWPGRRCRGGPGLRVDQPGHKIVLADNARRGQPVLQSLGLMWVQGLPYRFEDGPALLLGQAAPFWLPLRGRRGSASNA